MKNSVRFALLFALIITISSSTLLAVGYQNNVNMPSGTVNSSGLPSLSPIPTPLPQPTPTPNPTSIPAPTPTPNPAPTPTPNPAPKEKYVGFRCNGEDTPAYWISVANQYAALIPESSPRGIWIIASSKVLTYDAATDAALSILDGSGVKIYLQPGEEVAGVFNPYPTTVDQLIAKILSNYGHHSSVIGVGIDVELRGSTSDDYKGCQVTDAEATSWLGQIKAYNPDFKLFLKHWITWVLPPTARDDIIFVADHQSVSGFDELLSLFKDWSTHFSSAKVAFQVGYESDRWWWSQLSNPPRDIATAIFLNITNSEGVFWVNMSVHDAFP